RGFPLAVGDFNGSMGKEVASMVEADLGQAGFFRFLTEQTGAYVVDGDASETDLQGKLFDPKGQVLFQRSYRGAGLETLAHRFSDDIVQEITGTRGIASSKIAFVSNQTGRKELYLCDYNGTNKRPLTRDNSISVSPSFSPDGRSLAYTSYLSGYADVYVIDLPTGKRDRIISEPGTNSGASFSPIGDRLALTMSFPGNPEIFTVGIDGRRATRLTQSKAVESSPTWSPDGKQLIYVSDATGRPQLYQINAQGSRPEHLKLNHSYCVDPDWSPDGNRLAFNIREAGSNQIAIHDFRNNATKTITSGSNAESPVWGANSRHLIYIQNKAIVLHDVESSSRTEIVSGFGDLSDLAWTR
ncbi:MAG: DPP IV N-terminal domain-containing protein, partial [Verrucomicrobiota bacterium]